jgi:hypothetical protein
MYKILKFIMRTLPMSYVWYNKINKDWRFG